MADGDARGFVRGDLAAVRAAFELNFTDGAEVVRASAPLSTVSRSPIFGVGTPTRPAPGSGSGIPVGGGTGTAAVWSALAPAGR